MSTPYPLKVQAIRTQGTTPRLYVYFPIPLAAERTMWSVRASPTHMALTRQLCSYGASK